MAKIFLKNLHQDNRSSRNGGSSKISYFRFGLIDMNRTVCAKNFFCICFEFWNLTSISKLTLFASRLARSRSFEMRSIQLGPFSFFSLGSLGFFSFFFLSFFSVESSFFSFSSFNSICSFSGVSPVFSTWNLDLD